MLQNSTNLFTMNYMDKKRILIVEDDEPMQKVFSESLQNHNFETFLAKDGEEGLAVAFEEHPDLILLDILMPKMDGTIMLQRLREDAWGKTAPVIILTNVSPNANNVINSVLQNEPAYYLVKSDVRLEGIVEKINSVLKI